MTTATLLTPPGTGAIAAIAIDGPNAWSISRQLFQSKNPLPDAPAHNRFWFGKLAGDDVILSVLDQNAIELHCHGGRQVVQMILKTLQSQGCVLNHPPVRPALNALIEHAKTLKTANILLDQWAGAFDCEIAAILGEFDEKRLARLASLAPLGRHLVEPWKVVIAGAPNVGKSSLVNALAGYERTIVSPIAGTTRDAVSTIVAFDGWPVELTDTAGLRKAEESLEAAGIDRAREMLAAADVIVWVIDAAAEPIWPTDCTPHLIVANKCDLPHAIIPPNSLAVSATVSIGLPELIAAIVRIMVPVPPLPGEAVPWSPSLAELVLEAHTLATAGKLAAARQALATCLTPPE